MDTNHQPTICPWCQSEIVWDPEIGPEDECPYCFNELKDYRSITLTLGDDEDEAGEEEAAGPADEEAPVWEDWEEDTARDLYAENVESCIDRQEEAPECSHCRELMLYSGVYTVTGPQFTPALPAGWTSGFLSAPFQMNIYLCPSCFKTEMFLSESDRLSVIKAFREKESD
ncbi:Uncharacterised protein [Chlamydia abortus]|uniref:Uncharacterized protein n=1 Tax=Paenibacillus residui TaxID=629724 RepID=A0ABW3DIV2_9BACL|nr:hypothetical protein [Paenibacillus sp. 32O-W]SHE13129.1 Uncharacterised protein [Chlamydia abortus]